MAAASAGPAASLLPGAVPGTGRLRLGYLRRAGFRGCPVGAAPLLRRVVRGRQAPQGRGSVGAVPAAAPGHGAGPLVRGQVHAGRPGAAPAGRDGLPAADGAAGPGRALPRWAGPVGDAAVRRGAAAGRRDSRGSRWPATPTARPPTPDAWQGSTWGSSTRTRSRGQTGRGCWCRDGRSARSAACTCAIARPGPGLLPAVPRNPGSGGHGGGGSTAAASGPPRPVMRGVSARPSTKPPGPWWTGR